MTSRQLALSATLLALAPLAAHAQIEGLVPTQTIVRADSKSNVVPTAGTVTLELNSKPTPITAFTPVQPSNMQIALLIDDGLSRSAGIQLNDIRDFAKTLPAQAQLLVGYMTNGTVQIDVPFTTDHAAAADKIRLPSGLPGQSASPYFCLSDFVKRWPGATEDNPSAATKARFVIMITNGVDPYNGSTSIANQDSPYVAAAVIDSQRAGVAVSSIYYRDAGFRGGSASFSGQSYLQQVADGTGGVSYYQGTFNPVSLTPFFHQFEHDLSETYIATFSADAAAGGREHLLRIKMSSTVPKVKLRHPDEVRPGNQELPASAQSAPTLE